MAKVINLGKRRRPRSAILLISSVNFYSRHLGLGLIEPEIVPFDLPTPKTLYSI